MAEWRDTIAHDPLSGMTSQLVKEDGQLYLRHHSDPTRLVEENKRLDTQPQKTRTRLAARIPPQHYYIEWPTEFQMRHGEHPHRVTGEKRPECRRLWKDFVTRKLNSPEFRYLRIDGGRKL